jgi:hypothetical protein
VIMDAGSGGKLIGRSSAIRPTQRADRIPPPNPFPDPSGVGSGDIDARDVKAQEAAEGCAEYERPQEYGQYRSENTCEAGEVDVVGEQRDDNANNDVPRGPIPVPAEPHTINRLSDED